MPKSSSAAFCSTCCPRASCASVTSAFWPTARKNKCCFNAANCSDLDPTLPEMPKTSAQDLLQELTGIDLSRCPRCHNKPLIVIKELPPLSGLLPWDSS